MAIPLTVFCAHQEIYIFVIIVFYIFSIIEHVLIIFRSIKDKVEWMIIFISFIKLIAFIL